MYLVTHRDLAQTARVGAVIDFLYQSIADCSRQRVNVSNPRHFHSWPVPVDLRCLLSGRLSREERTTSARCKPYGSWPQGGHCPFIV